MIMLYSVFQDNCLTSPFGSFNTVLSPLPLFDIIGDVHDISNPSCSLVFFAEISCLAIKVHPIHQKSYTHWLWCILYNSGRTLIPKGFSVILKVGGTGYHTGNHKVIFFSPK